MCYGFDIHCCLQYQPSLGASAHTTKNELGLSPRRAQTLESIHSATEGMQLSTVVSEKKSPLAAAKGSEMPMGNSDCKGMFYWTFCSLTKTPPDSRYYRRMEV